MVVRAILPALLHLDEDLAVVTSNEAFHRVFGTDRSRVQNRRLSEIEDLALSVLVFPEALVDAFRGRDRYRFHLVALPPAGL
jgi:hypothetical protein